MTEKHVEQILILSYSLSNTLVNNVDQKQ